MATFMYRVLGALMLNATVFEDVEANPRASWQATAVVVLSSLATGLGVGGLYDRRVSTFVITSLVALLVWVAWATLTLQIGTRLLPAPETRADLGQLMRTIGFAASPGLFQIFAVFPRVMVPVVIATTLWMFAAMVVAVERALDYRSVTRALAVCALGAALTICLALVLAAALTRSVS
jgi:hypothetical protein